jgi:hypothetical protein
MNIWSYFSNQSNKGENDSGKVAEMQRRYSMQRGMKIKEMYNKYISLINNTAGHRFSAFVNVNLVNKDCPVNIIFSLW